MSTFQLQNQTTGKQAATAEFHIARGNIAWARMSVQQCAEASVPTNVRQYAIQATTDLGDFKLESNLIDFSGDAARFHVEMLMENGEYDFRLTQLPSTQPSAFVFESDWREPVLFTITPSNGMRQSCVVVDEHNTVSVSTAQNWTVFAIVNGLTTENAIIGNPNATITVLNTNDTDGYTLVVKLQTATIAPKAETSKQQPAAADSAA